MITGGNYFGVKLGSYFLNTLGFPEIGTQKSRVKFDASTVYPQLLLFRHSQDQHLSEFSALVINHREPPDNNRMHHSMRREGRPVDAVTLVHVCEQLGAGEILLNCFDKDGTNSGFDIKLINAVRAAVTIPAIASSGAGWAEHFLEVFEKTPAEAVLAAGIFHRKEVSIGEVKEYLTDKEGDSTGVGLVLK